MRRTTLGPVTSSRLNSRKGDGDRFGRPGLHMSSQKLHDRRVSAMSSLGGDRRSSTMSAFSARGCPTPSSRKSLFGTATPAAQPGARPRNDRSYMHACAQNLISFLMAKNYNHPISPKILTSPTANDFRNIFLFLMNQIDPSFKVTTKLEEEIPSLMKLLGYPQSISKSALSAVGSPHTWPSLLALLTWMLENIIAIEDTVTKIDAQVESLYDQESMVHSNYLQAYEQFFEGADSFPELDAALIDHFEQKKASAVEEKSKVEERLTELSETLDTFRTQPSPLKQITQHEASLENNIRKFKLLNPSLVQHRDEVKAISEKLSNEKLRLHEDLSISAHETRRLQDIIDRQVEEAINGERIAKDRARLHQELQKATDERITAEDEQKAVDRDVANTTQALDELLRKYHKVSDALPLSSVIKPNQGTSEFRIRLSRDASLTSAKDMLSANIDRDIQPAFFKMKAQLKKSIGDLETTELNLQASIDDAENSLVLLDQELSDLDSRKSGPSRELQAVKKSIADEAKQHTERRTKREEELSSRKETILGNVRESNRRLESLIAQRDTLERQFSEQRKRLGPMILEDIRLLREHKASVREMLGEIRGLFNHATQTSIDP